MAVKRQSRNEAMSVTRMVTPYVVELSQSDALQDHGFWGEIIFSGDSEAGEKILEFVNETSTGTEAVRRVQVVDDTVEKMLVWFAQKVAHTDPEDLERMLQATAATFH